ncbi:hypothetical protein ACIQMV_26410 [Streptomyces sp. NPDC091412]|uniref:hypothetical protein n=1 Tax=Streptomyces sp. NPDC091412 TaxID=3366002 RepID=UPI0038192BF5
MHRTTTTATLLVSAAVSALSGCVTVERPPAPGPAAATTTPLSVARPDGSAGHPAVQAPAREALEHIGNPRHSATPAEPAQAPSAGAPPGKRQPPAPAHSPSPAPAHAAPRHPRPAPPPRAQLPGPKHALPPNADLCALGRQYGGWKPDSPETRICHQTYNH